MSNSAQVIELLDDDENNDEVQVVEQSQKNKPPNTSSLPNLPHNQQRNETAPTITQPAYVNVATRASIPTQPFPLNQPPPQPFNSGMVPYPHPPPYPSYPPMMPPGTPMMYNPNMPMPYNPMMSPSHFSPLPSHISHYKSHGNSTRNYTRAPPIQNPKKIKTSKFLIPMLQRDEYKPHHHERSTDDKALYIPFSSTMSWYPPIMSTPTTTAVNVTGGPMVYKLSLLSVSEFTVQGRSSNGYGLPPSVSWMRLHIKKLSKPYGKAIFERLHEKSTNDGIEDEDDANSQKPNIDIQNIDQDDYTNNMEENLAKHVDGGTWRIPLGAYQSFYSWLSSNPPTRPYPSKTYLLIEGIPPHQLKIASLGYQRQSREYPSAKKLIKLGVPRGIALHLAPYQRGGVDFVLERGGKALIADEMGLGKTVQSIAAMTVYEQEWPLLIICPSAARYHWQTEFLHWIGKRSQVNNSKAIQEKMRILEKSEKLDDKKETAEEEKNEVETTKKSPEKKKNTSAKAQDDDNNGDNDDEDEGEQSSKHNYTDVELAIKDWHLIKSRKRKRSGKSVEKSSYLPSEKFMKLLYPAHVYVCNNSKEKWNSNHRIVILSYDLATRMSKDKPDILSQFQCIIVDESHMMKNLKTRRTKTLLPALKQASRCLLLSGTPAFARPLELYPQLSVLGNIMVDGALIWEDYDEFVKKYCKKKKSIGGKNLMELHTLLVSTVMIRRKKNDILKDLPKKVRQRAFVKIMDIESQERFRELMIQLRASKGTLGKLAVKHQEEIESGTDEFLTKKDDTNERKENHKSQIPQRIKKIVETEIDELYQKKTKDIKTKLREEYKVDEYNSSDSEEDVDNTKLAKKKIEMEDNLLEELGILKEKRMQELMEKENNLPQVLEQPKNKIDRKSVVADIFQLTGVAKVPVIAAKLKRWIKDPSKGKLCIFAHHLQVLDMLEEKAGIRPFLEKKKLVTGGQTRYIRIDGSTDPKIRHKSVIAFQNDPKVRIAFLGITAAGVAITLTAASTVWFAELFWTPALMLQAEDRCHRIGQTATVKCIYFIGKGSFDEVVWKLLENKFRTLGEFVEGKSQNIDVHKDGKILGLNESDDDDTDTDSDEDSESRSNNNLVDESNVIRGPKSNKLDLNLGDIDITREIKELSGEEQAKLRSLNEDSERNSQDNIKEKMGSSKNLAICLSDDEETRKPKWKSNLNLCLSKSNLRLYKLLFVGKSFGIVLQPHEGRVVVFDRSKERLEKYGENSKPHIGDVVYAIEDFILPFGIPFREVIANMRESINKNKSVELAFSENPGFINYYTTEAKLEIEEKIKKKKELASAKEAALQKSKSNIKNTFVVDS